MAHVPSEEKRPPKAPQVSPGSNSSLGFIRDFQAHMGLPHESAANIAPFTSGNNVPIGTSIGHQCGVPNAGGIDVLGVDSPQTEPAPTHPHHPCGLNAGDIDVLGIDSLQPELAAAPSGSSSKAPSDRSPVLVMDSDPYPLQAASTQSAPAADSAAVESVAATLGYTYNVQQTPLEDNLTAALRNAGNTCYLNALLNVLARVTTLRLWFQQHLDMWGVAHAGLRCPLCVIARDVNQLCHDVDNTPFVPALATHRASWSAGVFNNYQQQDVTEAITLLFDTLNSVDERTRTAIAASTQAVWPAHADDESKYTTPMWDILQTLFVSRLRCASCNAYSDKKERLFTLPVHLPDDPASIEVLLADYWGDQPLKPGDDPYRCPVACARGVAVNKTVMPRKWPTVLILSLKRWRETWEHGVLQWEKVFTRISFETILPIRPDLPPYHLRGVIEHRGLNAGGGHYTSYVRAQNNFWYFCDDNASPKQVSTETVLGAEPYVLVYEA